MKKIKVLLAVVTFLLTFSLQAQFSYGVEASFIRAWEDYGDVEIPEGGQIHVNGPQFTVLANYDLGKYFRIGLEPGYAQRGAACEPGFLIFNSDTNR